MHIKHILTLIPLLLAASLMAACTEEDEFSLRDPMCFFGGIPVDPAIQPPNTSRLVVELRIYDLNCVQQVDTVIADAILTGQLRPDPDDPAQVLRNATIFDTEGLPHESPYQWAPPLPATYSTFVDAEVVFMSIDAYVVVPSGYTLMCRISQDQRIIQEQRVFNKLPDAPSAENVLCLWQPVS